MYNRYCTYLALLLCINGGSSLLSQYIKCRQKYHREILSCLAKRAQLMLLLEGLILYNRYCTYLALLLCINGGSSLLSQYIKCRQKYHREILSCLAKRAQLGTCPVCTVFVCLSVSLCDPLTYFVCSPFRAAILSSTQQVGS